VVEELVWVLPCFVVLQDRVENLLLGAAFADVLWVNDSRIDVGWVIIKYYDFIDAINGGCTCDSSNLNGLVIGLLSVKSPAAG
jgi:hypothetical protein